MKSLCREKRTIILHLVISVIIKFLMLIFDEVDFKSKSIT